MPADIPKSRTEQSSNTLSYASPRDRDQQEGAGLIWLYASGIGCGLTVALLSLGLLLIKLEKYYAVYFIVVTEFLLFIAQFATMSAFAFITNASSNWRSRLCAVLLVVGTLISGACCGICVFFFR